MIRAASGIAFVVAVIGCGRGPPLDDADPPRAGEAQSAPASSPDLVVDVGGGTMMDFVLVAPGAFTMGAADGFPGERPAHRVVIAKAFYVGRFLVTQEQWSAVMATDPSRRKGARRPVENVTWNECAQFVAKLNAATPPGRFALPSEAQWEYACRAGSAAKWCFGNDERRLPEYAWYLDDARLSTHPVGAKKPNAWGLFDVSGHVWEWCADAWHEDYVGAPTDGAPWTTGGDPGRHPRRGGSWCDSAWLARCAYRAGFAADFRAENLGLRLVRDVAP